MDYHYDAQYAVWLYVVARIGNVILSYDSWPCLVSTALLSAAEDTCLRDELTIQASAMLGKQYVNQASRHGLITICQSCFIIHLVSAVHAQHVVIRQGLCHGVYQSKQGFAT